MNRDRLTTGFTWGIAATIVMSIPMLIGFVSGVAPMPRPIPIAVASLLVGTAAKPVLIVVALTAHLLYGGVLGAVLFWAVDPVTIRRALGYVVLVWIVMGVVVLPLAGWGFFGTAVTPKIVVATLLLHLVYGTTIGWLGTRGEPPNPITLASSSS